MRVQRRWPLALVITVAAGLASACATEAPLDSGEARAGGRRSGPRSLEVVAARAAPDEPTALAADARGVVVVGRDGSAIAYAPDGVERWKVDGASDVGSTIVPIAMDADLVVVPVFDPPVDSRVRLVERSTGATRWEAPVADPRAVGVGAQSDGAGIVAVVDRAGRVTLLEGDDGAVRVQVELGFGRLLAEPRVWVRPGRIVVFWATGDAAEVRVLDASSGAIQWAWSSAGLGAAPEVGRDQVLVVENTEIDGDVVHGAVRGLDLASGAERWSTPIDGGFLPMTPIARAGHRAVILDFTGRFTAFDVRTGRIRWVRGSRVRQIEATPLLTGAVVATTTYGTGLVALSAATGERIENEVPGVVQTAVTIEDSIAADGAILLLVRRSKGEGELWWLRPA